MENHKPSASHIILYRGHLAMNWIQTRNFRCDRPRLHSQLYIQLPYDHDYDGPSLIIIHVKYFNINLMHHMASRHKKYISVFNLFSGTRHQKYISLFNLFSGTRHQMYISLFSLFSGTRHPMYISLFNLFSGTRHQMYISLLILFSGTRYSITFLYLT